MNANETNTNSTATSSMRVPRKKKDVDDDPYPETWDSLLNNDDTHYNDTNSVDNTYDTINNSNSFDAYNGSTAGLNDTANTTPMKTILPKPPSSDGDDFPDGVIIPSSVTPDLLTGRLRSMLLQLPVDQINEALREYDDAARMKDLNIRNHYAYFNGLLRRFLSVHEKVKAGLSAGPIGLNLTDRVRERMNELVAGGYCTEEDMKLDDRVMAKLKLLSESEALLAFDELESVDRSRIRNFGSYFMGIVNRYMRGDSKPTFPSDSNRRDFGKRPDNNKRENSRWGNKNSTDRRSRSRSRSPENYRGRYGNGSTSNDNNQRRDYSRRDSDNKYNERNYRDNDYYRRGSGSNSNNQRTNRNNNRYSPRKNSYDDYSKRDYKKDNRNSLNYYAASPQLESTYTNVGASTFNLPAQQQSFQTNSFSMPGTIPPAIPAGVTPGYPQFQLPPTAAPQQPSSAPGTFNPNIYQPPNAYANIQQSNLPNVPPQNPFNTPMPPPQFNPLPPAVPTPATGGALDILDIANMAQQFLNQQTQPKPAAIIPPPQPPTNYTTGAVSGGQAQLFNNSVELPVMVKLAVQNLIATGHIDGDLDSGLKRLLNKLPEPVALEALNNYASCDLSRVRNKSGYLGGILKKHHEKATGQKVVW